MVGVIPTLHTKIMGLQWFINRLEALSNGKIAEFIGEILDEDKAFLIELQKDQLYAGQNAKGGRLAPSYLNDPFFKTPAAALKYARFKERLNQRRENSIFGKKDFEVPNLIVTGTLFYNTLFAQVTDKSLIISARTSILSKLESKYQDVLGLNKIAWQFYFKEYKVIERLRLKITTYLKA